MRPWDIIDRAHTPYDDSVIYLMERGGEYTILVDDIELMSNRLHGSEDALAELACDRLSDLESARVLVGGLGMGFTLAAVLRRVGGGARVTVAELIPAVVRWNRERLGRAARYPLRDARVDVHVGDVCDLIDGGGPWSAILLDVDNGPRALSRSTNGWLYTPQGLAAARAALAPDGVLGVWSAAKDASLTGRLRKAGFEVEVLPHTEEGRPTPDDSGTHILWMARRG